MVRCFLVELSGLARIELRRYRYSRPGRCPADGSPYSYCNATVVIDTRPVRWDTSSSPSLIDLIPPAEHDGDPRWPTACEKCGEAFAPDDIWQVNQRVLWRAQDGREWTQSDLPPGAIFDAFWLKDVELFTGPDGLSLMCVLPDGHPWTIDGQASNCTRKGEPHKCWVRHGEPPDLTVDKNGDTCAAGAGSIQTGAWHGFLREGYLRAVGE